MSNLTTVLIILSVLLLDLILVYGSRRYLKSHPLTPEDGVQPVALNGKDLPLLTLLRLLWRRFVRFAPAAWGRLKSFRVQSVRGYAAASLAGVAALAAGQMLRQDWFGRTPLSLGLLLLGLALYGFGVRAVRGKAGEPSIPDEARSGTRAPALLPGAWGWVKSHPWRALLLAAAPGMALAASLFAGFDAHMRQPGLAVAAWLLGILAAAVGGAWVALDAKELRLRAPWGAIAWGVALLVMALLFRALLTDQIPMALTGDEASVGISAQRFNQGLTDNIFTVGWFSFPSLFYYLVSISITILGNTIPALRLPSALAGALTVAGVYWLGRELFGHRAGLAAGLLLAALHFHVHYSRLGLNNAWDGLFYVITLGGFWVAWKHNSRPAAILAGLGLGFSQYFYTSGRLLVVLIPLLALWLNRRNLSSLRRILPNLLVIFWVALAVFLPLGRFFAFHPAEFSAPLNRVSLTPEWVASAMHSRGETAPEVVRDQVFLSLEAYTDAPLYSFWYDSRTPILLAIPAILFWLGLAHLALKRRGGQLWLLAGWLFTFSLVSMLSQDAPSSQRFVAAAPAAVLVAAAGLEGLLEQFCRLWPGRRAVFSALACALLAWAGVNEYNHYFREYVPQRSYGNATGLAAHRLASYLHAKPAGTRLAYFGGAESFYSPASVYAYLAPQVERALFANPWGAVGNPSVEMQGSVFAFLRGREADLEQAQVLYPGGKLIAVEKPDGSLLLTIYDLTPPLTLTGGK